MQNANSSSTFNDITELTYMRLKLRSFGQKFVSKHNASTVDNSKKHGIPLALFFEAFKPKSLSLMYVREKHSTNDF